MTSPIPAGEPHLFPARIPRFSVSFPLLNRRVRETWYNRLQYESGLFKGRSTPRSSSRNPLLPGEPCPAARETTNPPRNPAPTAFPIHHYPSHPTSWHEPHPDRNHRRPSPSSSRSPRTRCSRIKSSRTGMPRVCRTAPGENRQAPALSRSSRLLSRGCSCFLRIDPLRKNYAAFRDW